MPARNNVTRRGARAPQARVRQTSARAFAICLLFTAGLGAFSFLPQAQDNPRLLTSIAGAATALLAGIALLWMRARQRTLRFEIVLRAQHYLQATMQGAVYVYWGWYWRPVYDAAPL